MTNERAYTPSLVLHVLRNPHGWSAEAITAARLQAADEIERLKKREKDLMDVIDSRDRALGFVPLDEVHASEPCEQRVCQCATYCMIAVGASFDPPVKCRGLRPTRDPEKSDAPLGSREREAYEAELKRLRDSLAQRT